MDQESSYVSEPWDLERVYWLLQQMDSQQSMASVREDGQVCDEPEPGIVDGKFQLSANIIAASSEHQMAMSTADTSVQGNITARGNMSAYDAANARITKHIAIM